MAIFETWLKNDLEKPIQVKHLPGTLFLGDDNSNLIGVEVLDGGQAATLTGNVYGYLIREDDETVIVQGELTANKASITLPNVAYARPGTLSIVIKVGETTVGACIAKVYRSQTDTFNDPGNIIPSVEELLQRIQDAEDAADAAEQSASDASDYAEAAEAAAETALSVENIREIAIVVNGNKQDNIDIDVGDYVVVRESTIPGISTGLYRAINSIPHGTTITSADLSSAGLEKGGFNALNSKMDSLISFTTPTLSCSAGNGYGRINTRSGYTLVSIANTSTTAGAIAGFYKEGSKYVVFLRDTNTSAVSFATLAMWKKE